MISGCPTALSPAETRLLQQWARGRRVIECGALLGYSTIKLAQVACKPLISIDLHDGYSGPTWDRYRSNLDRAGVNHKVIPIKGQVLTELPNWEADLVFIDLTGQYKLTKQAAMASNSKFVAIHDFNRVNCSGVLQTVNELKWPIVDLADTLIILWKINS